MSIFSSPSLTNEDYWRAIILFGGNSATYKFALAKSLSEFVRKQQSFIRMELWKCPRYGAVYILLLPTNLRVIY